MVAIKMSTPTFLFDFYTHYGSILHRFVTIHNATDRQTEDTIGTGCPCYSIGGLKTKTRDCLSVATLTWQHRTALSIFATSDIRLDKSVEI